MHKSGGAPWVRIASSVQSRIDGSLFPQCASRRDCTLEAMRTQGARNTMRRPQLLKAGGIAKLRPAISAPAKGLVDVVKGFDSAPLPRKKVSLPCSFSGASFYIAGGERRRASFIAVVRE